MSTASQDREFTSSVISRSLLEDAIQWIASNMEPTDVFSDEKLKEWAEGAGYVQE